MNEFTPVDPIPSNQEKYLQHLGQYDAEAVRDPERTNIYVLTELIDAILESPDVGGHKYLHWGSSSPEGVREGERSYSFCIVDSSASMEFLQPINVDVEIDYKKDPVHEYESYRLIFTYCGYPDTDPDLAITATYEINLNTGDEPSIDATMNATDVMTSGRQERPMTLYDVESIAGEMLAVLDLQSAIERERDIITSLTT